MAGTSPAMTVEGLSASPGRHVYESLAIFIKVNFHLKLTLGAARLDHSARRTFSSQQE